MDINSIIAELQTEYDALTEQQNRVSAALDNMRGLVESQPVAAPTTTLSPRTFRAAAPVVPMPSQQPVAAVPVAPTKRILSAAARKAISNAQKARWAEYHRAQAKPAPTTRRRFKPVG